MYVSQEGKTIQSEEWIGLRGFASSSNFLPPIRGGYGLEENNMEQFKPMSLDEAIKCRIRDARAAKEYEQKEQDWLNSERMD